MYMRAHCDRTLSGPECLSRDRLLRAISSIPHKMCRVLTVSEHPMECREYAPPDERITGPCSYFIAVVLWSGYRDAANIQKLTVRMMYCQATDNEHIPLRRRRSQKYEEKRRILTGKPFVKSPTYHRNGVDSSYKGQPIFESFKNHSIFIRQTCSNLGYSWCTILRRFLHEMFIYESALDFLLGKKSTYPVSVVFRWIDRLHWCLRWALDVNTAVTGNTRTVIAGNGSVEHGVDGDESPMNEGEGGERGRVREGPISHIFGPTYLIHNFYPLCSSVIKAMAVSIKYKLSSLSNNICA
jgi:hypothetical protein